MAVDISSLLDRAGRSRRDVARNIHDLLGNPETPTAASLGTYIGRLEAGAREPWLKPQMAEARRYLAEVLGVDVIEIFPETAVAERGGAQVTGAGTPFRPFDVLRDGEPVAVGHVIEALTADAGRVGGEPPLPLLAHVRCALLGSKQAADIRPIWIVAPPGSGKRFTLALLAHERVRTISVTNLHEIAGASGESPLAVVVAEPDPRRDLDAIRALSTRRQLVIMASFERPGMDTLGLVQSLPNLAAATAVEAPGGPRTVRWTDAAWRPNVAGRRDLVRWAERRTVGPSLLSGAGEALADWFDAVDSGASLFPTPDAILFVCAQVHEIGLARLRADGLDCLMGAFLEASARRLEVGAPHVAVWLRNRGEGAIRRLLSERMRAQRLPGWRVAALEDWAGLIDAQAKISGAEPADRDVLATMPPSGHAVVDHLRRAQILVPVGQRQWRVEPHWFVESTVTEELRAAVRGTSLSWGRHGFDPARRVAVDRAVDDVAANPQDLGALLHRVPEEPRTASDVGAVEALFAAVARRIGEDLEVAAPPEQLHRLWRAQVSCAVLRFRDHLPVPMSRQSGDRDALRRWFADCWEWSFRVRPPAEVPANLQWLFPGWCRQTIKLAELPRELDVNAHREPERFLRLAQICSWNLNAEPSPDRIAGVWTAWAWAQLRAGKQVLHGERVSLPLLARIIMQSNDLLDGERERQGRAVIRAAIGARQTRAVLAGIEGGVLGPFGQLFRKVVDEDLLAEFLPACGWPADDIIEHLTKWLPAELHLPAVQWAVRQDLYLGRISETPAFALAHLSDPALAALAHATCAQDSSIIGYWAQRSPGDAIDWVKSVPWSTKGVFEVLPNFSEDSVGKVLDWLDSQNSLAPPVEVELVAALWVQHHPALAERLLPWVRHADRAPSAGVRPRTTDAS